MIGESRQAYYQRRSEMQADLAQRAADTKIQRLHEELIALYSQRARDEAGRLTA